MNKVIIATQPRSQPKILQLIKKRNLYCWPSRWLGLELEVEVVGEVNSQLSRIPGDEADWPSHSDYRMSPSLASWLAVYDCSEIITLLQSPHQDGA